MIYVYNIVKYNISLLEHQASMTMKLKHFWGPAGGDWAVVLDVGFLFL